MNRYLEPETMTPLICSIAPLWAVGGPNDLWYALPLIVSVSLVYSATRFELPEQIISGAIRMGSWILGFMLVIFAVLALVSWRLQ